MVGVGVIEGVIFSEDLKVVGWELCGDLGE